MSINRRMHKKDLECVCVHACVVEHYSAIKRKQQCHLQQYGMHLEAIILSEQSQTETYIQYHSYVTSKKFNLVSITEKTQTQNSLPVGRGTVRGNTEGGGGEVQAPVPKTAYKDAVYNTGI